jgi:hypothetical protein
MSLPCCPRADAAAIRFRRGGSPGRRLAAPVPRQSVLQRPEHEITSVRCNAAQRGSGAPHGYRTGITGTGNSRAKRYENRERANGTGDSARNRFSNAGRGRRSTVREWPAFENLKAHPVDLNPNIILGCALTALVSGIEHPAGLRSVIT